MNKAVRFAVLLATLVSVGLLAGCEVYSFDDDHDDDKGGTPPKKNPPSSTANSDRQAIIGTWDVTEDWRWSALTFNADGSRSVKDPVTGETIHRGTWRLDNGQIVVVSDVTERWDYTISGKTMTVTLPSGTTLHLVKQP